MRCFLLQDIRRKFRRQTSDNMDRWKAEMGRVSEKRRIEERRSEKRKSRRKKMQMREKVGKSRNTVFFQWFVAPEGRKVGSLKRRVRSHLARWEMKNCTPLWREAHLQVKKRKKNRSDHFWKLRRRKSARHCGAKHISKSKPLLEVAMSKKRTPLWREAHFEVKMYKAHEVRTTFGSWDVEKAHAVVARSTFRSQNVQSTPGADHFWKLRCRKSARRCGAKHVPKSKCTKHTRCGPLLEVAMSKKCTPLWREAHFEVKMYKTPHVHATFGGSDVLSRGRRKGLCTFSKVSKTWGFCSISKNDGRRRKFEENLQRCIFRGRRSTRDIFIRAVRRSGRWFPETGCILEHQIFRFAEMILRDRCSTSYDLASLFRSRRSSLDRWTRKIAKRIGTRPSALHATFHFCRKSCRILSYFLMLSTSKNEEVSQNSFLTLSSWNIEEVPQNCSVFDVVKFKHWGSFAESLRFWCCQVQNLRTSRRIASFSSLQIDR